MRTPKGLIFAETAKFALERIGKVRYVVRKQSCSGDVLLIGFRDANNRALETEIEIDDNGRVSVGSACTLLEHFMGRAARSSFELSLSFDRVPA